jgi:hypothetical protein
MSAHAPRLTNRLFGSEVGELLVGFGVALRDRDVGAFKIGSDQATRAKKTPTWITVRVVRARWCARTDALFDVAGMHVLDVCHDDTGRLVLTVETDATTEGCLGCGVVATGHGRRRHRAHDAPCFGRPAVVVWRRRI